MKTFKTSTKGSKIKLNLEDFTLNKIENLISVVGGSKKQMQYSSDSTCTSGDSGCCDDCHEDDSNNDNPCVD